MSFSRCFLETAAKLGIISFAPNIFPIFFQKNALFSPSPPKTPLFYPYFCTYLSFLCVKIQDSFFKVQHTESSLSHRPLPHPTSVFQTATSALTSFFKEKLRSNSYCNLQNLNAGCGANRKIRALYRKASAQIAIITRFKCAIYDFTYKIPTYFYGQSAESPHLAHKNKGIMFVIFYYSAAFKRTR